MQLDKDFQESLRAQARAGATVVELIRLIREHLKMEEPGEGRLWVVAYLAKTFAIPLDEAAEISGWQGFDDGGRTTNAELEIAVAAYLRNVE
jgi:hypothetical protein